MADHSELKKLTESLNRAIEQAEHKPGQWAETAQSMGGICCAGEPFQIGKPWAKEDPWAHFSYKRDSWLAVAAVNALPRLMALIVENEALKGLYRMHQQTETREMRDLKAEIAGLKTGFEAYEQVNAGLKAEVARSTEREILQLAEIESLRKDLVDWQEVLAAVKREVPERFTSHARGNAPGHSHSISGVWDDDNGVLAGKESAWCKAWSAAMGKGEQS
ncbi:hypothetical protein [Pseudomonas kulmbachensis]|uniref:hypothetical protein n=1 Tax=Pseudomonas kulmbachensis TaxID=3043408 RepID=UPI002AAF96C0|nr:hypothetical protein [Pseudomonas sp. V3/3/4/13]